MRIFKTCLVMVALTACRPSQEEFIKKFEPAMLQFFCAPKGFTVSCYDVTEAQCLAVMKPALTSCIEKHKAEMPEKLDEKSGAKIGEVIGTCAGVIYGNDLIAKHTRTDPAPKCDDPSNQTHWPLPTP